MNWEKDLALQLTHYRRTLVTLVVSKAVLYFILLLVIFLLLLRYV